jgi:hypothetical protein
MSSGAPYVTPIYSEESLEASTEQNLLTAFKELPNDLVALVAKRYPQGLPFVIIDGTLMRNTWGADGLFDEEQNVIFLKKEGFTKSNDAVARQRTVNVIAHELGHALLRGPEITTWTSRVINLYSKFSKGLSTFGPGDSRYFIADLLKQTRDAVYKEHQHRYVSAYSLLDADEFFADNSAAFFNTNTTESKCDYDLSSRSRENLRAIQPEMYLSMRLFYENTSPIFGYDDVFEKESYPILSRLVEEIPADQENRPITELYDRYRTLRWPTS